MQWWCAASAAEWTWAWRPYPGVWLAVGLVGFAWARRLRARRGNGAVHPSHLAMFGAGLLTLWLCLDWPVGALGAGYLLSVHSGQYVVLSYVAIPLLLLGIPAENLPIRGGAGGWLLRRLTHAGLGLGIYAAAMGVTHLPAVVDPLMRTQAGSFGIDLVWIVGALSLWWPVVAPPGYVRMSPPVRIGYLFLATIPPTIPAAFMVFADYPLYAVYELAPRVGGISAAADQQVAGVLMKAAADPLLWIAMAIVFFTWQRTDPDGDDAPPASQETFS